MLGASEHCQSTHGQRPMTAGGGHWTMPITASHQHRDVPYKLTWSLSWKPEIMSVAMAASNYATSGGIAAIARSYGVSRRTARDHCVALAGFGVAAQEKLLKDIESRMTSEGAPNLLYAACALMYDEAGQKLTTPLGSTRKVFARKAGARKGQLALEDDVGEGGAASGHLLARVVRNVASVKLEVCVARMWLQWLEQGDTAPRNLEIFIPPSAIPSTSARHLWGALRGSKLLEPVLRAKAALLNRAAATTGIVLDIDQTDNASGNDLFFAACCHSDPEAWNKTRVLCLNHQVHLGMMQLFGGAAPARLVGNLYTICAFLRMGVHMLRVVLGVQKYFRQPGKLSVVLGHPPDSARHGICCRAEEFPHLPQVCGRPVSTDDCTGA